MNKMNRNKIQTFNDGILSICTLESNDEKLHLVLENLRYENRTVGSSRYFQAKEAQHKISRIVRIPQVRELSDEDIVVVETNQFRILQVQSINDTFPKCWQLTLEKVKRRQMFKNDN